MIVCSFSTPVADLKRADRTPDKVLACLRQNPRVSAFDLSGHAWLRDCIRVLESQGRIEDDKNSDYPWVRYTVLAGRQGVEG